MAIPLTHSVGDEQQYQTMYKTDGLPALLTALYPILSADVQRIIKYKLSRLKAHPMLVPVDPVFVFIPDDLHCHPVFVTTL
jgi:hypothetical protein